MPMLRNPTAKINHTLMPPRYVTWADCNMTSRCNAGQPASFAWTVWSNDVSLPFNTTIGSTVQNPGVAINAWSYAGVSNFLYTSATGSGLYSNYRLLKLDMSVTWEPVNSADTVYTSMAPSTGTALYPTQLACSQAPYSVSLMAAYTGDPKLQTLRKVWNLWDIIGQSYNEYLADPNNKGSYASGPANNAFIQVWYQTGSGAVLAGALLLSIKLRAQIEYFNTSNATIEDT